MKKEMDPKENDSESLLEYLEQIEFENIRNKNLLSNDIIENGEQYIAEMKKNKVNRKKNVKILIEYILEFSEGYTFEELSKYDDKTIHLIYKNLRKSKRSIFKKLIDFLLN